MKAHTPVRQLVSRHTRELLRRYHDKGLLDTRIADRKVEDRFVEMTADERALYEAVESYISTTYNKAAESQRRAVGFIMTVYRRRLASSCQALRKTLRRRLHAAEGRSVGRSAAWDEDRSDDELSEFAQTMDADDVAAAEREALVVEEAAEIRTLLESGRAATAGQQAGGVAEDSPETASLSAGLPTSHDFHPVRRHH